MFHLNFSFKLKNSIFTGCLVSFLLPFSFPTYQYLDSYVFFLCRQFLPRLSSYVFLQMLLSSGLKMCRSPASKAPPHYIRDIFCVVMVQLDKRCTSSQCFLSIILLCQHFHISNPYCFGVFIILDKYFYICSTRTSLT